MRSGDAEWSPAQRGDVYCIGDSIRTLEYGSATLLLADGAQITLDQGARATVESPQDEARAWLDILRGAFYFISRNPTAIGISTPYANAGIEGTEFVVTVTDEETTILVFEGTVAVANEAGQVSATDSEQVIARTGQIPVVQTVVQPRDAVQWALYYPPIVGPDLPAPDEAVPPQRANDATFFTQRAAARLDVGRVEEASADLREALTLNPGDALALSLQSIIAVTQNDKNEALRLADQAVGADPALAATWIALSYARQASFDVSRALSALQEAVVQEPGNALAWARLAELWLAVPDVDQSESAARQAVSLNPNIARTQTVLGFAYLTRIELDQAMDAFRQAIEFDDSDPLPRLGLGLALIRDGELSAGREQIEIAVILDPGNALVRSYVGKAYFDEKRNALAASQLEIARELDPLDPTPFFYDAIRKQTENQPVAALDDLSESVELNDNRAVYRSKLLLDQDLAARSSALGRVYRDLGFEQGALVEGWRAVNADPGDFSGHRFLADTYSVLPRHEIARVSELLQSQLLQPLNITPIQPQLTETNLFVLSGSGPSDVAFNEFNPLFARDRVGVQFNAVSGSNETSAYDLVVSGIAGAVSYSVGRFDYSTDGFRINNDQDREISNAFLQIAVSPRLSVNTELRSSKASAGDLAMLFDPESFQPGFRVNEDLDLVRIGMRYGPSRNSDVLVTLASGRSRDDTILDISEPLLGLEGSSSYDGIARDKVLEVQHHLRLGRVRLISGAAHLDSNTDEVISLEFVSPFPFVSSSVLEREITQSSVYLYSVFERSDALSISAGLSADSYDRRTLEKDEINPKLGVTWNPTSRLTFRAAVFRTLARRLLADQTIEPTQIAGFNQFFPDTEGEETRRGGIALDYAFSRNFFAGAEVSERELTTAVEVFSPIDGSVIDLFRSDADEELKRLYAHWAPTERLALSAQYVFEHFGNEDLVGADEIVRLRTHRLPVSLRYFSPAGWIGRLTITRIDQKGVFGALFPLSGSDRFTVVDAAFSYRLPGLRGMVSLEVRNLLDEKFSFQDTEPGRPLVQPDRMALLKLNLSF